MASALAAALAAEHVTPEVLTATVLLMLTSSAVLTGALVFLLGALKRGRLVRFFPYSVSGGFLAGTGYLIAAGGFKVLTGKSLTLDLFRSFPHVPISAWLSAAAVAGALLLLSRRIKHYLLMPAVIASGVLFFYASLQVLGVSLDAARGQEMLFQPLPASDFPIPAATAWGPVRWDLLLSQWQNALAMAVVVVVTILLNATGLDLATQQDVDFDRELRVNGIANIIAGLCGGIVGYISISRSLLNFKAGADSRLAGVWTAVVCLGAAFIFTPALSYVPRPVLAGILLFLGLSMLREWVWDTYFKLPHYEYLLIVAIMLLIATQGLILGVITGLLVASVLFVYNYSRTNCIRHSFSSSNHFSHRERSWYAAEALRASGMIARTLCLQGYLFFGTVSTILEQCRELIERQRVRYLLLDFRMVQGLDASAALGFSKLDQICVRNKVLLIFTGLSSTLQDAFEHARFLPRPTVKVYGDMDRGLEWIEDYLLGVPDEQPAELPETSNTQTALASETDLRSILVAYFTSHDLDVLIEYCELLKPKEGEALFRQGDPGDALYFIEQGEVSVLLRLEDGKTKRLRSFGPGTVVGEMALYTRQPRSADVVTETSCRVRKLSGVNLGRLEREHPEVALQFHAYVVKLLAGRLGVANEEIRTLL